ncbi:MAG TPA: hypothetical protein VFF76_02120 [Holophagaceae bacterium]|nr:hypothetical protein [Holophagaceae bacterium]
MARHATRMLLLMAGALLGGPHLQAQGLPNPLNLPDPLGITDSKGKHQDRPQPGPPEKHHGRRRGQREERQDRREDRRDRRHDERREERHDDHHRGR